MNKAKDIQKAKMIHAAKRSSAPKAEPMADESSEYFYDLDEVRSYDGIDMEEMEQELESQSGRDLNRQQYEMAEDNYGNASGSEYDLAVDGAFTGNTITVIQLYTEAAFDFEKPKAALEQKGFNVVRYIGNAPSPEDLREALDMSCQLWIISDSQRKLNDDHLTEIKAFFDEGHGVYIWGDNDPYYADANFVAEALLGVQMHGNLIGSQTVTLREGGKTSGLTPNHLITTGLEFVYEGITIATLDDNKVLEPLIYGSAGNLVTAVYNKDGKRCILDGGFTRLYCNWQTAGTARYVKNAAAWLVNYERFGDEVVKK